MTYNISIDISGNSINVSGNSIDVSGNSIDVSENLSLNTKAGSNITRDMISPKCVYQIRDRSVFNIGYFLNNFMNGTVFPGSVSPDSVSYDYRGEMQLQAIFNEGSVTFERINETWKNISDAITWYMRQNGNIDLSAPAQGEAFQTQTCVHIRWLFLLYPAVLVLLAIIFFTAMVFETHRREISRHDWKSSPLALLFHGLDRKSMGNGEYASITQANEMARIADQTPVRLVQTDYGWQFSRMGVGR